MNSRDRFFDFDHIHVTEAGRVAIYRYLENYSMELDQNQVAWSIFDTLLAENIKMAKIKIWKNRFSEIFSISTSKIKKKSEKFHSRFWSFDYLRWKKNLTPSVDFSANSMKQFSWNRLISTLPASVTWPRTKSKNRSGLFNILFILQPVAKKNCFWMTSKTAAQSGPS